MSAVLSMEGVVAGYGEFTVLRGITIEVPARSVVALIGANGTGKTTTLRVAAGLVGLRAGRVVLDGVDVSKASAGRRARSGLCLIPEGRGIYKSLTVRENLRLYCLGAASERGVDPAIDRFPVLGKKLSQRAGSLSGGEQQMLALSRAFLSEPKLVMVDEASMGLAPVMVMEILGALEDLRVSGVAVLIVEQFVERALEMADWAYVLAKGEVEFSGPAKALTPERLAAAYLGTAEEPE